MNGNLYTKEVVFASRTKREREQLKVAVNVLLTLYQNTDDKENKKKYMKQIISNSLHVVSFVWKNRISDYCSYMEISDDVCQSGVIGIARAVEHYKQDSEASFFTYAETWVYGEMMDTIYRSCIVKLPVKMESDIAKVKKWFNKQEKKGENYSIEEAKEKAWSELKVFMQDKKFRFDRAFDFVIADSFKKKPKVEYMDEGYKEVCVQQQDDFETNVVNKMDVQNMLDKLSEEQKLVICKFYFEQQPMAEIQKEIKNARVLKKRAIISLRKMMAVA